MHRPVSFWACAHIALRVRVLESGKRLGHSAAVASTDRLSAVTMGLAPASVLVLTVPAGAVAGLSELPMENRYGIRSLLEAVKIRADAPGS